MLPAEPIIQPSTRIDCIALRGHTIWVKRDDLIDPFLSGNKYYKLYRLIHTAPKELHTLKSWGGAQSNAMLAIAALCHRKGWRFEYATRTLPAQLSDAPSGNLKVALELGMQLQEYAPKAFANAITSLRGQHRPGTLVVAQGGADAMAMDGIKKLADTIEAWRITMGFDQLCLATPSGTGTTAAGLAKALPHLTMLTTPLVGDCDYLLEQIGAHGPIPDNLQILDRGGHHRFAKPEAKFLSLFEEIREATGIVFDLIYGVPMWHALLHAIDNIKPPILYIHSGGLSGNATMLERYASLQKP